MSSSAELRAQGNSLFNSGDFAGAETLFSQALEQAQTEAAAASAESTVTSGEVQTAVLLANRAAARHQLGRYDEALQDGIAAAAADPKWIKAYYRMSSALEALGRHKEAYEAWVSASSACDPSPALSKQLEEAKERWLKKVRDVDVENSADFLSRYTILPDPRERLSTLAHFWNESSTQERLSIVVRFGNMISGPSGPPSRLAELTTENMASLPMENYFDLPITRITKWVAFYRGLDEESKAALCEGMWMKLSPHEQNAVVNDLSMFIIQ